MNPVVFLWAAYLVCLFFFALFKIFDSLEKSNYYKRRAIRKRMEFHHAEGWRLFMLPFANNFHHRVYMDRCIWFSACHLNAYRKYKNLLHKYET